MRGKTILWGVAAVAICGLAIGASTFDLWKIRIPRLMADIANPVGPVQDVTWAEGPSAPPAPVAERPPNIVLIVADDLGFNDITAYGGGVAQGAAPTPAIDSLMRDGATVRGGYASHATCSPTRAALMTGRYPSRLGFEYTSAPIQFARTIFETLQRERETGPPPIYHQDREADMPPFQTLGLPQNEVTIAELLAERGYRNLLIGKWHLGDVPELQPHAQGFDEWLGFTRGATLFGDPRSPDIVNAPQDFDPIDRFLWANLRFEIVKDGGRPFRPASYLTDYLGDQAAAAIQANRNRPFFLYLAFNAPHTPLQALRADYEALSGVEDHALRTYAAMIAALDRNVGKVLAALEDAGLSDNTLVIFTSDNGGANYVGFEDINAPYRGWKATFFEGGVHVPYMLRWPARIPAGVRAEVDAASIDIFATIAAAAGAVQSEIVDGIDLTPILRGETPAPARPLFWRAGEYRAVLHEGWKLQIAQRPAATWLFNLHSDPTERTNLAAVEPERVAALRALLDQQDRLAAHPLWPALVEAPILIDAPANAATDPGAEYVYWGN